MKEERKTHPAFKMVGPSLATKGNGTRIFAKLFLDGRWTWRTTKTDKLELARKWKENWDENRRIQKLVHVAEDSSMTACLQNQKTNGNDDTLGSEHENSSKPPPLIVDQILDNYVAAGQPTVKKRKLKPKSPTSIRNEQYSLHPLRIYFGRKIGERLTLADCDGYHAWRNQGGYVSTFSLRGHQIEKRTKGGNRVVDLNLVVLSNALELAIRQGYLMSNPIKDRGRYSDDADVRHCREVAPTPRGLVLIVDWLERNELQQEADFTRYLAYTGLRLGEGLNSRWPQVDWKDQLLHVRRSKRGVSPFVPILPELEGLLHRMEKEAKGELMFPSPFDRTLPRDGSSYRRRLAQAAATCCLPHVTPQGLRSYFVTQARQSGLTDAEVAQLIGDKTGPVLISEVYGDVRPDHLLAVARKIKLTAETR